MKFLLKDWGKEKTFRSEVYNSSFNKETGRFVRWGKTFEDDPEMSFFSNEILDIEISSGKCSGNCLACYKSNNKDLQVEYMSLDLFKQVMSKFPKSKEGVYLLQQCAMGITDLSANPDMWAIMDYCREIGIIPNITINGNGLDDLVAIKLQERVGAIAVSNYNKDKCYDAVKLLTDRGVKQVNIHQILCEETYAKCFQLMQDAETDPRLEKLGAIVFLSLKPKGDKNNLTVIRSKTKFKSLVSYALDNNIRFGFDSCSAVNFEWAMKELGRDDLIKYSDPCESSLFSWYINDKGLGYPCSFCEGEREWKNGIDFKQEGFDFHKDVWYNERVIEFRNKLKASCRSCPMWNLELNEE